jgi:hypothetical protein
MDDKPVGYENKNVRKKIATPYSAPKTSGSAEMDYQKHTGGVLTGDYLKTMHSIRRSCKRRCDSFKSSINRLQLVRV